MGTIQARYNFNKNFEWYFRFLFVAFVAQPQNLNAIFREIFIDLKQIAYYK